MLPAVRLFERILQSGTRDFLYPELIQNSQDKIIIMKKKSNKKVSTFSKQIIKEMFQWTFKFIKREIVYVPFWLMPFKSDKLPKNEPLPPRIIINVYFDPRS